MLGIDYPSSDEDEVATERKPELINIPNASAPATKAPPKPEPVPQAPAAFDVPSGPSQGPTVSHPPEDDGGPDDAAPSNTSTRAIIQNLTLPTVPNFDIPASPPGSPPLRATKKFVQFLELKKKGQHFNQRLEGSSVLRDPGHVQRLMDFAGISEEDSYATTMSDGLAIPVAFPGWAYAEELRASQKNIFKAREQGKSKVPRDAVEFVSAIKSGTSSASGTSTPAGTGSQRQGAAERVTTSVDHERTSMPSVKTTAKRKQLEHRGREESSTRKAWSSGSRSPKRRRSTSRDGRG